jgi:hypothetical protein
MDSIVGFAANGSGLFNVDSEVMPTNFAHTSRGRGGPPSETPGKGRPPCPPNNPHCIPEPPSVLLLLAAVLVLLLYRSRRK